MTSTRQLRWAMLLLACTTACRGGSSTPPPSQTSTPPASEWFVDRAAETGLDFVHFNGMSGALYYAEHMGPGVALFDYDNDGDLDVFIPQGQMLGAGVKVEQALFPPKGPPPVRGRLFRNDLHGERRRDAGAEVHRRDRRQRHRVPTRTGWASPPATTTTTAASTCTSRRSAATSCSATAATARSPTCRSRAGPTTPDGAVRRRSSTTIATAGSICSSATI